MEEKNDLFKSVKLLVVIIDRAQRKKLENLYKANNITFNMVCLAQGTANSELLEYLGLGEVDKCVVISTIDEAKVPSILKTLSAEMHLNKPGRGIACTASIGSMAGTTILNLLSGFQEETKVMTIENEYSMIMAIVNHGYASQAMHVAKEAGATGGTIINARSMGATDSVKFFGISIQDEKEILLILANNSIKSAVMKAISDKAGVSTECGGIILSLPVDNVLGLAPQMK